MAGGPIDGDALRVTLLYMLTMRRVFARLARVYFSDLRFGPVPPVGLRKGQAAGLAHVR